MKDDRFIQITKDGSHTIAVPALNVTYHSSFGALQESDHVFINAGLKYFIHQHNITNKSIKILEIGFGTGLNALLTLQQIIELNQKIFYEALEPFPLSIETLVQLNYTDLLNKNLKREFYTLHNCEWNKIISIHELFSFKKIRTTLEQFETTETFDVIYFDAFDPNVQPELWTEDIFRKIAALLNKNGLLVTYSSKGSVRRAMQAAGFKIEKLKGPAGKREMVRAVKH